jgi:hypothetical protein
MPIARIRLAVLLIAGLVIVTSGAPRTAAARGSGCDVRD